MIIRIISRFSLLILTILFINQCASSNFTGGVDNTYTSTLGTVEDVGFDILIRRLESVHQYEISRRESFRSGESYIETYWKRDLPFGDTYSEREYEVETKITLRARPKTRSGLRLYTLSMVGEYREQVTDSLGTTSFKEVNLPPQANEYFKEVSRDLNDQVIGSIRGY